MVNSKPASVKAFNQLNLAATLIGIGNILFHYSLLRGMAIAKGTSPAGPMLGVLDLAISYLIFWFFIYRRGSNIAKWIFVILTVLFVALLPSGLREALVVGKVYAATDVFAFALQIVAMAMLFRPDASVWLKGKGAP